MTTTRNFTGRRPSSSDQLNISLTTSGGFLMSTMTQGALMESLMAWEVQRLVDANATRMLRECYANDTRMLRRYHEISTNARLYRRARCCQIAPKPCGVSFAKMTLKDALRVCLRTAHTQSNTRLDTSTEMSRGISKSRTILWNSSVLCVSHAVKAALGVPSAVNPAAANTNLNKVIRCPLVGSRVWTV
jgi:hypothetical protein